ncbi:MAG: DUF4158 domain-containing protein [Thainema sp.]
MKRTWENHELVEHWTIDEADQQLIRQKRGINRLGFALLLKFFQLKGRFPEKKNEIPRVVRTFVSEQLSVDERDYEQYDWQGRGIKRHRVEIRKLYGFHRMRINEFDSLRQWLIDEIVPLAVDERRLQAVLYEELRTRKIEPPSYAQIERLINSAHHQFESQLCDSIVEQLPAKCRQALDSLTGPQSDSWILDADEIPLNQLKQEAGGVGLKSLKAELSKLKTIEQLALATDRFKGLNERLVDRYRQRVETESLTEIRRHPDPIRYLLLSAFCYQRSQEIVDSIIELFILLVHRLESRSRRRVSSEIVATAQETKGHDQLLYHIAVAALAQPEGTVQEVIYPVANKTQLETVVETLSEGGKGFNERLHTKMRRSYTHYYRRLLPLILNALEFRSDSLNLKPLLAAIQLLKASAELPSTEPYAAETAVPMDGVLSPEWQDAVMVIGSRENPRLTGPAMS